MVGELIAGRYRVVRELGRGGMGVVYLVREKGRRTPLALKLLLGRAYSESALKHFEQEFRTLTSLSHPNLTEVHEFGRAPLREDGGDAPYFTMEFVDGEPLDAHVRRTGLDWERLYGLLAQVGHALAYLHGRGLVHRDVKPSNVLVAGGDGDAPRLKLMDLGLAGRPRDVGVAGSIRGTAAYLSPEAARGDTVDPRSDLYSLGCVVYELVCGRPPFQGNTALTILRGHLQEAPLPLADLHRDVPAAFERLVLRLLEKDPGRRPASSDRFLRLLDDVAGGTLRIETPEVRRHRVLGGGFVGRERELGRLAELARNATGRGTRLVLLAGEAGIGKSRLLREFQVRSQLEGFELHAGGADDEQGPLAAALRTALRSRGPLAEGTLARHRAALSGFLGGGETPADPAPEADRFGLPAAVSATVCELAGERPLGLALDDLHRADETTCSLLRHLVLGPSRHEARLLLVGTYRTDEVSRRDPLFDLLAEARREGAIEETFLDPLGPDETAALVRACCGAEKLPEVFLERMLDETRGNPLHVGELLALLAEEGHLRPGEEPPVDPASLQTLELPRKIRDLMQRRLAAVEEEPLRVLQGGAALGHPVLDPDAIAAVTGMRWEHVVRHLLELAGGGLVVREEDERGTPSYRVTHPGLAALATERASGDERRLLHARAVTYLDRLGVARTHAAWAEFARHAELAAQPGRAVEAYTRAGELARTMHAHREAVRLFGLALELAPGNAPAGVSCDLLFQRGQAQVLLGDLARAEQDYRRMGALAERAEDEERLARSRLALGAALAAANRHDEARVELERAREIAGRLARDSVAAEARIGLGRIASALGRFEEGAEHLDAARSQARSAGDKELELAALLAKGALLRDQGDFRASLSCFREAAERAGDPASPAVEEAIHLGSAGALEVEGSYAEALEAYATARERARERGDARRAADLGQRIGAVKRKAGTAGAAEELQQALQEHRELASGEGVVGSLCEIAALHAARGRHEAARETAEEALEQARRVGRPDLLGTALAGAGRLHLRMGDRERAAACFEEAGRAMKDIRNLEWQAGLQIDLGDLGLHQGDPVAGRQFQEAAFLARRAGDRRLESVALCGLGNAHLAERDYDRALASARKARKLVDGSGLVREEAEARLLQARVELARPGGDVVGAEIDALEALRFYRDAREPEGAWRAEHVAGRAEQRLTRGDEARERIDRAHRYLEGLRTRLSGRWRETFLDDPARAEVYEDWAKLRGDDGPSETREHEPAPVTGGELARARRERDELQRLLEINRSLASSREIDALLDLILEAALELTGAERGFLLLREADEMTARKAKAAGGEDLDGDALELSRSIASRTLESGEPLLCTDAEADERLSGFESVHDLQIRSVLAVPLPLREGRNGAIYLDSRLGRRIFTPRHMELVSRLADQAALALGTAGLLSQVEEQRSRLERLNAELEKTLAAQRDELADAREALTLSRTSLELRYRFEDLIGASAAMQLVYHLIERLAPKRLPVLVTGESGTGKELIARALHAKSGRSGGPFFTVNCAAVNETLLESELFGYRKGAFTGADRDKPGYFELAHGGTLFLDEIGEMGAAMQAKLLGAIERGEVLPVGGKSAVKVDARIVAATHRDLEQMIREKAFREDLYYRINVGRIRVPPLRERREDIPLLVDHFLARLADEEQQPKRELDPAALRRLGALAWPGNVRELQHQILRVSAFAHDPVITRRDLERYADLPAAAAAPASENDGEGELQSLEELERRQIGLALERAGGNKTRAAELLGINRATLFRKLKRLDL